MVAESCRVPSLQPERCEGRQWKSLEEKELACTRRIFCCTSVMGALSCEIDIVLLSIYLSLLLSSISKKLPFY